MMLSLRSSLAVVVAAFALASGGCGSSTIPSSSGAGRALEPGTFALLASDYRSTNVALRDPSGVRLTPSLLSTASASAGVSFALSGDVVLPSEPRGVRDELVLVDRYGTNVLTFVDPVTGRVRAQLPVGTGFESNPQDFLAVEGSRALVTRFGVDPRPGDVALDGGDDVLVVDTATPALVSRIALPLKGGIPARPGSLTPFRGRVYVNLHRLSPDFDRAVDADLAVLDPQRATLERLVELEGARNCGKVVFSRAGNVAFACSGLFDPARSRFDDTGAGVVVGELASDGAFLERARWDAKTLGATPTGNVAWVDDARVVFSLFGGSGHGDTVATVAVGEEVAREVHRAAAPYTLGPLRCRRGASFVCAMPEAGVSAVLAFSLAPSGAEGPIAVRSSVVPDVTGLPLRDLAFFE